jgi:hypothetical protein
MVAVDAHAAHGRPALSLLAVVGSGDSTSTVGIMQSHVLEIDSDAANTLPNGVAPRVRWAGPLEMQTGDISTAVQDWAAFDGGVVAVGTSDGETLTIGGSGVMVAPGLVLTATHVLRDEVAAIEAHELSVWCLGLRRDGRAELWALSRMRFGETESDLAFLAVRPYSKVPAAWALTCLALTTRLPAAGDPVTVVGFRFDNSGPDGLGSIDGFPVVSRGRLYASAGTVLQVDLYRDSVLAPFPYVEVGCGTLGGMSGGAVIDARGAVMGILSVGLSHEDGRGPSHAAWILQALQFDVALSWPRDVYPSEVSILDLPEDLMRIIGREHVELIGPLEIDYRPWR